MSQLIHKLSFDLCRAWVKEADRLEQQSGQITDFSCFVKFVAKLPEQANSLYGRRVFNTPPSKAHSEAGTKKSGNTRKFNMSLHKVQVTSSSAPPQTTQSSSSSFGCFYHKDAFYRPWQCTKFKSNPLQKRSKFIKEYRFCYKCRSSAD